VRAHADAPAAPAAPVGYLLDGLPPPPRVRRGGCCRRRSSTLDVGHSLCVVLPESKVEAALDAMGNGDVIGSVVTGPDRRVEIPAAGLVGRGDTFS